jgi:hypothetical protein
MQNKEKENSEDLGYELIAQLFLKIGKIISRLGGWFVKRANKFHFEKYKLKFGERDDDIYISTYPKSGTTMMQVILYQLTTEGNMNFNHIYEVSPWIRNAAFKNQKVAGLASPRLIKTHDSYKDFPKETKGCFIHVHREGKDVAVSLYNQNKNYNNNNLKFEKFLKNFLKEKTWFKYSKNWFRNKKGLKILHVHYENLLKDKLKEILRIVQFLELNVDQEAIDRAVKYSSFEYMKEHENKFGEQPPENPKHKKLYENFIRKGKIGEGDQMFTKKQKETYDKYYKKIVKPFEKQ